MNGPYVAVTCLACDVQHAIAVEVERRQRHWGADADGNRGFFIPAHLRAPENTACPACGLDLFEDIQQAIGDGEVRDGNPPPDPEDR